MATRGGTRTDGPVGLADTHCHLTDPAFANDVDAVIARARGSGVTHIVAVGGGGPIEASETAAELAARYDFVRATAGIHPHDASTYDDSVERRIVALLDAGQQVSADADGNGRITPADGRCCLQRFLQVPSCLDE